MEEPKNPDEILVYEIYKSIASPEQLREMGDGLRQGRLGYGHIKNMLLDAVVSEIRDAREKYNYYMAHYDEVEGMLEEGAAKARPVARATLKRLNDAVFGRYPEKFRQRKSSRKICGSFSLRRHSTDKIGTDFLFRFRPGKTGLPAGFNRF